MASSSGKYPPSEFSQKYASVLAPKGKLVSPKDVFGNGDDALFGSDVEEKTKQAFKVTIKKCEKLNMPSAMPAIKEELAKEKIDQIVECFPNTLPKELPDILQKSKWSKPAKEVENWDTWWEIHEKIFKSLKKQSKHINAWLKFAEIDVPEDAVLESMKRLVSGVLTHPITIGRAVALHTPKRKKNYPKSVHLVGTDRPEATMIYAGFYHEILACNPLNPIKLTLVSPDPANQQLSRDCSPDNPMLVNPRCKLTAWAGLYHDFWDRFILTQKVEQPDIVVGIHPGLHAEGIFEFWEPTLELLLDNNIKTVFTVLSKEEYVQTLDKLDGLFCRYVYKGLNSFGSKHVKQTKHDANLMWASNQYMIIFKGRTVDLKTLTLIEEPSEENLDEAEEEFEKLLRESGGEV